MTAVRITSNLEKFQRRQYFRLECIHEMDYRIITPEEEILERKFRADEFKSNEERNDCRKRLSQYETEWLSGAITDISGGGARFTSSIQLGHGDRLRIKLDLVINNELKKMILGAYVVASSRILNKSDAFEHRVEFHDIMQKDREDLIKYIFEQERRRRKNDKS